jgi:hypothetical protein
MFFQLFEFILKSFSKELFITLSRILSIDLCLVKATDCVSEVTVH